MSQARDKKVKGKKAAAPCIGDDRTPSQAEGDRETVEESLADHERRDRAAARAARAARGHGNPENKTGRPSAPMP